MPFRPKIKRADGTSMDLPLEAETTVKMKDKRKIGLSGVIAEPQPFDGTADVTIPVTEVPASLLTGTASIPTTGEAGSAKDYNTSDGAIKEKFAAIDANLGRIKIGTVWYSLRTTTSTSDSGLAGYITIIY